MTELLRPEQSDIGQWTVGSEALHHTTTVYIPRGYLRGVGTEGHTFVFEDSDDVRGLAEAILEVNDRV